MLNVSLCLLVFSAFLVSSVITTETLLSIEGAIAAIIQAACQVFRDAWSILCQDSASWSVFTLDGEIFVLSVFMILVVARIAIVKLR